MSTVIKASIFLGITTIPLILRYFLNKTYRKLALQLQEREDTSYYECIFFDYKNFYCRPHLMNKEYCGDHCSYTQLERLLRYIASAKTSISICMYILTLRQINYALVVASQRGVHVRVITDTVMAKTTTVQNNLQYLRKNGVAYKTNDSTNEMMHHKFCLIDEKHQDEAKVFFGSINLTVQAFCKNFEALILTNNQEIIQRFSEEFEDLWGMF